MQICLRVPTNQPSNLLQMSEHFEGTSPCDSIAAVWLTERLPGDVEAIPQTHPRQLQFRFQGAVVTIHTETGNVTWEGYAGSDHCFIKFEREDTNRRPITLRD